MRKISVVVPAYNAENTIERCILSILNQTHKELEVIVVNDGSTDNTEKIINKMICNDCRIKLINIPNGGVSHARNKGIDNASGDYITFVDSDDYIDKEMYETLLNIINENNVMIAHCSYKNVDESGNVISVVGNNDRVIKLNHDEALSCLISGRLFIGGLWNKLFHRSLFETIRLDEDLKYAEDILANFQLFDLVDKSIYIDKAYYNYVSCENSATHSAETLLYSKQWLYVNRKIYLMSKGKDYEALAERAFASGLLATYKNITFSKNSNAKKEKNQLILEILYYKKKNFYNLKEKLLYYICRYFPWSLKIIFKIYDKIRVKKLDPEQ